MSYGKTSKDWMKERHEALGEDNIISYWNDEVKDKEIPFFSPKPGDAHIRVLPGLTDRYSLDIFVHWTEAPKGAYLCLQKMFGKPCPFCEEFNRLKEKGMEWNAIRVYLPSKRVIMQVIDRKAEDKGVQIYDAPPTVDEGILGQCIDKRTGEIFDLTDPNEGYDVWFKRTGKGKKDTKYTEFSLDRKPSPLGNDRWLTELYDIKSLLKAVSYEEMKNALTLGVETKNTEEQKKTDVKEDIGYYPMKDKADMPKGVKYEAAKEVKEDAPKEKTREEKIKEIKEQLEKMEKEK